MATVERIENFEIIGALVKNEKELLDRVDWVETDTFQDYPVTEAIETIKELLRIIIKQTYELNNLKSE